MEWNSGPINEIKTNTTILLRGLINSILFCKDKNRKCLQEWKMWSQLLHQKDLQVKEDQHMKNPTKGCLTQKNRQQRMDEN